MLVTITQSSLRELEIVKKMPLCKLTNLPFFQNFSKKFEKNFIFRFSKFFSEKDGLFLGSEWLQFWNSRISIPLIYWGKMTSSMSQNFNDRTIFIYRREIVNFMFTYLLKNFEYFNLSKKTCLIHLCWGNLPTFYLVISLI